MNAKKINKKRNKKSKMANLKVFYVSSSLVVSNSMISYVMNYTLVT